MELSVRYELDELLYRIESAVSALRSMLLKEGVVSDHCVYSVEKKGASRKVEKLHSLRSAVGVFSDFECIAPDNSKETSVYPGYIALSDQPGTADELKAIVAEINASKQALKAYLDSHNKPKRISVNGGPQIKVNPLLFDTFPMKNPTQIFREVKLLSPVVDMFHVKWRRKQRYDKHTIDSALRIVAFNFDKPPALKYSTRTWQNKMVKLKEKLDSLPVNIDIKRIKPAPPTAQAAVRFKEGSLWGKHHGSLPIIFTASKGFKVTSELNDLTKIDSEMLKELGWTALDPDLGFYFKGGDCERPVNNY